MSIISEIEGFFTSKCKEVKLFLTLVKLEAKLAGLSIFPLIMSICMLFVVLITLWVSAMTALGYGVISQLHNPWWGLGSVILLNLILCGILAKTISYHLKNLSFANTRQYFNDSESPQDEQSTQTTPIANTSRENGVESSTSECNQ